jgi:hypothetical protein
MADLTTIAQVEAELAATADYDVSNDVEKAKRRVAALRRKLDFPSEFERDALRARFALDVIERETNKALAFVQANVTPTEAQRLANPNVLHADFSGTSRYAPSGGCQ